MILILNNWCTELIEACEQPGRWPFRWDDDIAMVLQLDLNNWCEAVVWDTLDNEDVREFWSRRKP